MAEIRVLVGTTDYERSTSFYRDVLGFHTREEWDAADGRGTLFDTGAGIIEIVESSPDHPAEQPRGVKVAIQVPNARDLHDRLVASGVAFSEPIGDRPWGHRNFELRDPSGLPLIFFQVLDHEAVAL